jgi:hypothetical protein
MSEEIALAAGDLRWLRDTIEELKRLRQENALLRQWMREATGMSDADLTMAVTKARPPATGRS